MNGEAIIRSHSDNAMAASEVRKLVEQGHTVYVRWSLEEMPADDDPRTDQQRKAIEVYCRNLAETLNLGGLDQRKVLAAMKEGAEIPWSQATCKENLWRTIQIALLNKKSTTKLLPPEVSRVYEVLNRFLVERFNVSIPFPSRFGND